MKKNIFKSKKLIIPSILVILTIFIYFYSQKDFVTTATGDMVRPRAAHQAILMHDGRVFIIGGEGASSEGDSAEIYDPKTGKFTFVGNMNEGVYHKPVLLSNNQILLVCTCYVGNNKIPHSEIFDPAINKFVNIGSVRYYHDKPILFLLPNAKVFVSGITAELYDPTTRKFSIIKEIEHSFVPDNSIQLDNGNVLTYGIVLHKKKTAIEAELYDYKLNRFFHTKNNLDARCYLGAIALKNGKALFIDFKKSIAEIYDSATNSFHQINYMNIYRDFPQMIMLKEGKVLVLGGQTKPPEEDSITQAEIFDPDTETFTLTGNMNRFGMLKERRGGYTSTLLPSGKVLITGGYVGKFNYTRASDGIEIYNPQTGKFTKFKMRTKRRYFTQTLLQDGSILITGGDDDNGHLDSAEVYRKK